MNAKKLSIANVLATGAIVLVLTLTGLFWARSLCRLSRANLTPPSVREVTICPSYLFSSENSQDANLVTPSAVTATASTETPLVAGLGVAQYVLSRLPMGPLSPDSHIYYWESEPDEERIYYDPVMGQMVHAGTLTERKPDGTDAITYFTHYAGPEGVGLTPDEKLGRFVDPVVDRLAFYPWVVYDRGPGRFFLIDWRKREVRKGPDRSEGSTLSPVQIGLVRKNPHSLRIDLEPPSYRDPGGRTSAEPTYTSGSGLSVGPLPVLDASGRIGLLDLDTLELAWGQMRLVAPASLSCPERGARPKDVAAYFVEPFFEYSRVGGGGWVYGGTAVATLSSDATTVRLEVIDANGMHVDTEVTTLPQYIEGKHGDILPGKAVPSAEAAYLHLPGALATTIARFTVENLHPPALMLLSYFTGPRAEATAGSRSLFFPPDSFVARKARGGRPSPDRALIVLLLMAPGLLLAVWLADRVGRDATRIGLPKNVRKACVVGTFLFGLPAYITYCLAKPRIALVTCANCGLGRRPDMERCHQCGSVWTVPELIPPAWRVVGQPEQPEATSSSPVEETSQSTKSDM